MKRLLSIAVFASLLAACNDSSTNTSSTTPSDSLASTPAPAPAVPDTSAAVSATPTPAPAMKDGLMTLKDGKMMVMKDGAWEPLKKPVTCTNGRKVSLTGEVSKGGKKRKMTEGMMIDKDGQMMDKDGKMMDTSGWE